MYTIIALFALAAVVGLTLLLKVLKGEKPARMAAFIHGGVAAVALVWLLIVFLNGAEGVLTSLIIFVVAALGGFYLFFKDLGGEVPPKGIALVHAGAAVVGFVLLLLAVL